MTLPEGMVNAVYHETEISRYQGNPLIEALPPILDVQKLRLGLASNIEFNPTDIYLAKQTRIHVISQLLDSFFQPLSRHVHLELKLSIMLRQGYVGRNLATGLLNSHIQNGYERIQQGNLSVYRFEHVQSTAKSMVLIGCSGSGKTVSLNRILATYPKMIYHEKYNFIQIVFLKIDCPHDGSLKSLCHNFFREIDSIMSTNYVRRYVQKRHSVETLIALMAQIANTHAIGLLVIDEIQHLNVKNSGGAERMLNFFVTLVNEISVPIVMVGTPKASPIFEMDLRSARRGAGFGSILWEPLSKPSSDEDVSQTEWGAFTTCLWKYQWLTKANDITNDIRDTWYDLSQGIMDIVIKLFVLSQIRAIVTGIERITPDLIQKVYEDELKPIHPMINALRSGDISKIARFSDLTIPDVDIKILEFSKLLQSKQEKTNKLPKYQGNDKAIRLHNLLVDMGFESDLLEPLINRALNEHPGLTMKDWTMLVIKWSQDGDIKKVTPKPKAKIIKMKDWHTLDSRDLRFLRSQADTEDKFQDSLNREGIFFDTENWLRSMA
ncbi:AAA family ATPase [Desulfonatronum sp. SC1]|uniref:AAA family ATPase n=1 Tax=Desulfonatronum sp. SC1 TaxID=2109626 RepID=UPI000D31E2F9|nr:AAA family ATPase [Desulfonatronum sp. SC1]PTN37331.1 transcriptional antiterminator [Desulfonatronum sp. SC1]